MNKVFNKSTKSSPAFLNLGRNPGFIVTCRQALENTPPIEFLADRLQRLPALCSVVKENLKKANARQAKYFNNNRTQKKYEIGDEVVRKNHVLSSAARNFAAKLSPPFKGPCNGIEKVLPVVYELRDKGNRKKVNVHLQDIKKIFPPLDEQ